MIGCASNAALAALLRAEAGPAVVVLFGLVTQLGDVWFLFLLGGLVYLAGDALVGPGAGRHRGLFVLSLAVAYVSLIEVVKPLVGDPRPPGAGEPPLVRGLPPLLDPLLAEVTTADGHSFPSGHALGSTMVWGGLALVLDRGTRRRRLGVAAGVVLVVSASRLVLGVHYPVDVAAGAALGLFVLGALYALSERGAEPGRVLAVSVGLGLVALLVTVSFDSAAAIGGALGAWLGWRLVADRIRPRPTDRRAALAGIAVLLAGGLLFGAVYVVEPPHAVTVVAALVAVGTIVVAPYIGERLTRA